jgi:hypothetical protein
MKCLYYLAPTLANTQQISDDLHAAGIRDFYLHVIAKDEAGLRKQHIHSSNYLETLDLVRDGFIGGGIGFLVGLAGAGLLAYFQPFSTEVPSIVYVAIVILATLLGTWEGGLVGIGTRNHKLARFDADIEAGKYLVLVYVRKEKEDTVTAMMRDRHPEAALVAVDRHFINPFTSLQRQSESTISGT